MLATWLFWTAAGSGISSALRPGKGSPRRTTAVLECLLAVSLQATIWALRAARSVFASVPGELVGPIPMMLTTLVCLSAFCAISGALFVVAARMVEDECGVTARVAAGSAYLLEAAGSALGGILASIVLLRFLGSFQIAILISLLNLFMAAVLLLRMSRRSVVALACAAALSAIALLTLVAPRLDKVAQTLLWRGFSVVGSQDTITATGRYRNRHDPQYLFERCNPSQRAGPERCRRSRGLRPARASGAAAGFC